MTLHPRSQCAGGPDNMGYDRKYFCPRYDTCPVAKKAEAQSFIVQIDYCEGDHREVKK